MTKPIVMVVGCQYVKNFGKNRWCEICSHLMAARTCHTAKYFGSDCIHDSSRTVWCPKCCNIIIPVSWMGLRNHPIPSHWFKCQPRCCSLFDITFSGAVILQEYTVSSFLYCQTLQRLIFEAGMWHSRMVLLHRIHFSSPEGPSKKTSLWKTLLLSANNRLNIASGKLCKRKDIVSVWCATMTFLKRHFQF